MKLILELAIERLKVTDDYFFRMAYVWKFGRDLDVHLDVSSYKTFGIIPPYVREYISHLVAANELPQPT